ncbi:MAG: helix-hairpin-helix domain-containing protein [Desulfobulbaceae bacterium]|nr:helix-hairpin-helix domain-containing protein [Desulfobulbaceae bacterium]
MSNSNNDFPGDGRLTILLFLMFSLLFFDFAYRYQWSLLNWTHGYNSIEQLNFVDPNKLIIENYADAGMNKSPKSVPAVYTPFFFELIPINRADKDMLMSVKGIGPALADNIVEYRQNIGRFRKSKDLQKLKGIGAKRAAKFSTVFTFSEEP